MDPITLLTPLVVELVNEFRHRNDEPTEEEIIARVKFKLEHARSTGHDFLSQKGQS